MNNDDLLEELENYDHVPFRTWGSRTVTMSTPTIKPSNIALLKAVVPPTQRPYRPGEWGFALQRKKVWPRVVALLAAVALFALVWGTDR